MNEICKDNRRYYKNLCDLHSNFFRSVSNEKLLESSADSFQLSELFRRKTVLEESEIDGETIDDTKKRRSLLTNKKRKKHLVEEDPMRHGDQSNTLMGKKEDKMSEKRVSISNVGVSFEDQRKLMKRMAQLRRLSEKTYEKFMRECQEVKRNQEMSCSSLKANSERLLGVRKEKDKMQSKKKIENSTIPRILVLGNRNSGKTTLINRLSSLNGQVSVRSISTNSLVFNSCSSTEIVFHIDGCTKRAILCDLDSVNEEKDLLFAINQSSLIIIVYSNNDLKQFEAVHDFWIPEVEKCDKSKTIIVIGMVNLNVSFQDVINRLDNSNSDETEEIIDTEKRGIHYLKCDINDGESITEIFKKINDSLREIPQVSNKSCCIS